jgi:RNA polymerase sigma factor FliA
MIRALWTAGTGMNAQQTDLEVIASDVTNANTAGIKKSRADFQGLAYQSLWDQGATPMVGNQIPTASAREKTIEEFLPTIKHLAYKVARGFENENIIDDLVSAGIVGLLEVMEKYDASRGAKLNTFAYLRIRGAMIDELRCRDWFPRSARTKAKRIQGVVRKLEGQMGRYPNEEEIAKELDMDLDDYLTMLGDCGNLSVVSLEDLSELVGESRETVVEYVLDDDENPEKYAEFRELEEVLAKELDRLPDKQRLVLTLYYHEDLNMREIAKTLGVTEARICQLHAQAILNLRPSMQEYFKDTEGHCSQASTPALPLQWSQRLSLTMISGATLSIQHLPDCGKKRAWR